MANTNTPATGPEAEAHNDEQANTVADINGRLQGALSGNPKGNFTTVEGTLGERRARADLAADSQAAELGKQILGDTRMGRKFEAD